MSESSTNFVLVLDLQLPVDERVIVARLPANDATVRFFKLSEVAGADVTEAARERRAVDFDRVAVAVDSMMRAARRAVVSSAEPVHWYVCGRAPLPFFSQVGHDLSAWAAPVCLLNQRKDGEWDEIHVRPSAGEEMPPFFDVVEGLAAPSDASGRVAVFVSVMGQAAPRDALRDYVEGRGEGLAGIVEIRTEHETILDAASAGHAADELARHMSSLARAFPHALSRGVAVFVAGPALLAYLAGRAVNRNIVAETWFPQFAAGVYTDGVSLPLQGISQIALDGSAAAIAARAEVRELVRETFESLQRDLAVEHLPGSLLDDPGRARFIDGLQEIEWSPDSPDDGFALRVLHRKLAVGDSLIEALRALPPDDVAGVARQLVVHELYHDFQALTRANYREIGRAGVVLEELDFWADVFSVQALTALAVEEGASQRDALHREIDRVLVGIETFDRSEQGTALHQLYERRLRRYLIWYLQRARAATLRQSTAPSALFGHRLLVELVPTAGYLDERGDKIVRQATDRTQLAVICDGRLERFPRDADLDPAALVEDVRRFRRGALTEAMERVVGKAGSLLAPWAVL